MIKLCEGWKGERWEDGAGQRVTTVDTLYDSLSTASDDFGGEARNEADWLSCHRRHSALLFLDESIIGRL